MAAIKVISFFIGYSFTFLILAITTDATTVDHKKNLRRQSVDETKKKGVSLKLTP